ncbi:MAG: thiol reductase thioredoxin, partial [Mycoplasma sp.]|nr:thiol reductase thioredoxin [Mycoplasma sp.]
MAVQVIDGNQLDNYLTNEKTILVFFTYWCGPCKMLAPILEEISDKYNVLKIQGDIETKATTDFKIE